LQDERVIIAVSCALLLHYWCEVRGGSAASNAMLSPASREAPFDVIRTHKMRETRESAGRSLAHVSQSLKYPCAAFISSRRQCVWPQCDKSESERDALPMAGLKSWCCCLYGITPPVHRVRPTETHILLNGTFSALRYYLSTCHSRPN
jgi:hypothetical protein